jgi:hypothetical protein
VAIGSPKEVNLDIELRAYTAQNILNPSHDTFDRAQKRIQALMEKDSYPRFLESSLYKSLLGSYTPPSSVANQQMSGKTNPVCMSNENIAQVQSPSTSSKSFQLKLFTQSSGSQVIEEQNSQHSLSTSSTSNQAKSSH